MNETPLMPWLIVEKDGKILAAHCNCMAGLGETCSHAAAVMFYIDAGMSIKPFMKWTIHSHSHNCNSGSHVFLSFQLSEFGSPRLSRSLQHTGCYQHPCKNLNIVKLMILISHPWQARKLVWMNPSHPCQLGHLLP